MKFVASRLSEGNKLFPAEIHIEENGIKVKIPGFLRGDTKFIDYENISAVDVNTPMIGYSSITFYYQGSKAFAHGFTKGEAKQIKEAIDKGKVKSRTKVIHHDHHHDMTYNESPRHTYEPPTIEQVSKSANLITSQVPSPAENANQLYNNQIENLINLALADGELTEKEKQILFRKAEAAGIDLDEFEMVLEAKLYERNQAKN